MIRINLLPVREARRRADLQQQLLILGLVVGIAVLGVGYMHYSVLSDISGAKARRDQIQAQIDKFKPQLEQVEAYKKKKAEVQKKLDVIGGLERSRSGPVHMMDELATHSPDRMWLTKLEAKGVNVTLAGKSLDKEVLAVFLTSLDESPYFGHVELQKTELQNKAGFKRHQFVVTATIEDPKKDAAEDGEKDPESTTASGGGAVGR
jgi:type IV pilus assembly protein PilN